MQTTLFRESITTLFEQRINGFATSLNTKNLPSKENLKDISTCPYDMSLEEMSDETIDNIELECCSHDNEIYDICYDRLPPSFDIMFDSYRFTPLLPDIHMDAARWLSIGFLSFYDLEYELGDNSIIYGIYPLKYLGDDEYE